VAKWIVDPTLANGTHSSLTAAYASATAGDTIVIRPCALTEDPTAKAGVNVVAWDADALTPNVTIIGKVSATFAGSCSFSGINFQTNSNFALAVTGSSATVVNCSNCNFNCANNTGIDFTSSSSSSLIQFENCTGNIPTTGVAYWTMSSPGSFRITGCHFENSGQSTTASTNSAGVVFMSNSRFIGSGITSSSSGVLQFTNCTVSTGTNATAITHGGSATNSFILNSNVAGGTSPAIQIDSTMNVYLCNINSSNTNAITGAGTINYGALTFSNTGTRINTSTQVGGSIQGIMIGNAPSTGFVGELIESTVAQASAVTLTTNSTTNVTSISLSAGIWNVSCLTMFEAATALVGTVSGCSITTSSASNGTIGNNYIKFPSVAVNSSTDLGLSIPTYRLTLSSTTTVYQTATALFSSGTYKAYGRLSATRVG
jgi:hypothetical protein